MAQLVGINISFEPGSGLPGSATHRETPDNEASFQVLTPGYTGEALLHVLEELAKRGLLLDGPLTIDVRKIRQVGGSDGGSFQTRKEAGA